MQAMRIGPSMGAGILLLCCGSVFAQTENAKPNSSGRILPLIENYKAPAYPRTIYLDRETYDYRISSNRLDPETLTDVFICDGCQRVEIDLKLKRTVNEGSEDTIPQAPDVYLKRLDEHIASYLPWT